MGGERFFSEKEEIDATNNFWVKLPDDDCSPIGGEPKIRPGNFRETVDRCGMMDSLIGGKVYNCWKPLRSALFLGQTYREFFLTIDTLVEEFGIKERLQEIFDKLHEPERDPEWKKEVAESYKIALGDERVPLEVRLKTLETRQRLFANLYLLREEAVRLCLPVFRRLLEMGYTQRDLAS